LTSGKSGSASREDAVAASRESWGGKVILKSITSLTSVEEIQVKQETSETSKPLLIFEEKQCKHNTFKMADLEFGIAKGGSILGNKIFTATREENVVVGYVIPLTKHRLLLAQINGETTGTAAEAIKHLNELTQRDGGSFGSFSFLIPLTY
jgi:hypothetical protein